LLVGLLPPRRRSERLRENLNLMPLATEEMIRCVTPVKEFMRTAGEDTTVRNVRRGNARLATTGESVRELAEAFGIGRATAYRYLSQ
jgi:cytochrome P450